MPEATPYPMTRKARTAAKSLAIAYAAYQDAARRPDSPSVYNSTIVWGRALIEAQSRIGVELHSAAAIQARIRIAQGQLARVDPTTVDVPMRRSIENARQAIGH